jgi:hypothetical protein
MSTSTTTNTNTSSNDSSMFGEDYAYYNYIKTPAQLGMSTKGNLTTVGKDIVGLTEYVKVMVTGNSKASATGKPLGNKYFLQSGGKCTDVATNQEVDRYIYINNVPSGNIPFISSGLGVDFTDFRGLIPGALEQLNNFNPVTIFKALTAGSNPPCQELTMQVIDQNNNVSTETNYVTLADIAAMDSCTFPGKKPINPITKQKCKETFENMDTNIDTTTATVSSNTSIKDYAPILNSETNIDSQMYFASVGILGIYIAFKGLQKMKLIPQ